MGATKRVSHSKTPRGAPSDTQGEQAIRRWFAERHPVTISEDIGQIAQEEHTPVTGGD